MTESTSSDVGLVLGSQDATPLEFWVGVREGEKAQIIKGVNPGERVVSEGGVGLSDGAKVKIEKPGEGKGDEKKDEKEEKDEKKGK